MCRHFFPSKRLDRDIYCIILLRRGDRLNIDIYVDERDTRDDSDDDVDGDDDTACTHTSRYIFFALARFRPRSLSSKMHANNGRAGRHVIMIDPFLIYALVAR